MSRIPVGALLAAVLASGLLGSATAEGNPSEVAAQATVKVAYNKSLKRTIVVDGRGRTVYMFTSDTGGTPTCAKADPTCPKVWPAFTSTGPPRAARGIKASLLGTAQLEDGRLQVTYNRHPLYYYRGSAGSPGDRKSGDVKGQAYFGLWFVLSPKGRPIRR